MVVERARAHQRAEARAGEAQATLAALLESGGVDDPEDFRRRAQVAEERRTVEAQRNDCELRLRQIVASDDGVLEALDAALRETTQEEIAADFDAVREERDEAQQRERDRREELGRVRAEIDRLHDDETASEARARMAVLDAGLHDTARKWSSLVVARALLRRTRERYERERQPAVIQHAEHFFRTMTGGRYIRLYQPLGESTVTMEERDGSTKTPDRLSRGTKEQLYLALRLGAIEEAARSHEPLPVIVDEVLVNFDETRACRAAEAFVQLAQSTQVIVFTCHPWVTELFEQATRTVPTICLE